jgi:hypothetical protein
MFATMAILLMCGTLSSQRIECSTSNAKVGVYYYAWYGSVDAGVGRHWNDTKGHTVVDEPLLGFYSSQNSSVVEQHLKWFKELGISFMIISWWGPDSYEDNATKTIFSIVKDQGYPIEITIMVEAYNHSGSYNFKAIYDYINVTYIVPYGNIYMNLDNLPLICFFNDNINMTSTEEKRNAIRSFAGYSTRIVGQTESYVDWWAWPMSGQSEAPAPRISKDGYVGLLPRYDDSRLNYSTSTTYDIDYAEGLYDNQWEDVVRMESEDKIKYVAIYSWNEYPERSQIEPHINPKGEHVLSLYSKTYHYINAISETSASPFLPLVAVAAISVTTTLCAIAIYRKKKRS